MSVATSVWSCLVDHNVPSKYPGSHKSRVLREALLLCACQRRRIPGCVPSRAVPETPDEYPGNLLAVLTNRHHSGSEVVDLKSGRRYHDLRPSTVMGPPDSSLSPPSVYSPSATTEPPLGDIITIGRLDKVDEASRPHHYDEYGGQAVDVVRVLRPVGL